MVQQEENQRTDEVAVKEQPPAGKTQFSFDIARYRPGVVPQVPASSMVSHEFQMKYDSIPPAVWQQVDYLYITGAAADTHHLRALVKSNLRYDVPITFIDHYITDQMQRLEDERDTYLTQTLRSHLQIQQDLSVNPVNQKYHNIAANTALLLDGVVTQAVTNGVPVTMSDIGMIAKTLETLRRADPASEMGRGLENKKNKLEDAGDQVKEVVAHVVDIQDSSNAEVDEMLSEFETRTQAVLEED